MEEVKSRGKALEALLLQQRTALYRWMWVHYDECSPIMAASEGRRGLYVALQQMVSSETDIETSPQNLRQTWLRVVRDKSAHPRKLGKQTPSPEKPPTKPWPHPRLPARPT